MDPLRKSMKPLPMLVAIASVAGLAVFASALQPSLQRMQIHVLGPQYTLAELRNEAELVVLATPIDHESRWNSRDGALWTSAIGDPTQALIYTDTRLRVLRVVQGSYPSAEIEVRTVGGVVGNSELTVDQVPELRTGQEYVLLLQYVQTPTREGFEGAWAPVSLGQGVFQRELPSEYRNVFGETFAGADFDR